MASWSKIVDDDSRPAKSAKLSRPSKAYIFLSVHGYYTVCSGKDTPLEPIEKSKFKLRDTGIEKLTWVRSVPGGVCNISNEDHVKMLYDDYKEHIINNSPLEKTISYFSGYQADYLKYLDEEGTITKLNQGHFKRSINQHFKIHEFSKDNILINKSYSVDYFTEYPGKTPDENSDFKIILINDDGIAEDITFKIISRFTGLSSNIKSLLKYISGRGYNEVELIDLSCAAGYSGFFGWREVNGDENISCMTDLIDKYGGTKRRKGIRKIKKRKSIKLIKKRKSIRKKMN